METAGRQSVADRGNACKSRRIRGFRQYEPVSLATELPRRMRDVIPHQSLTQTAMVHTRECVTLFFESPSVFFFFVGQAFQPAIPIQALNPHQRSSTVPYHFASTSDRCLQSPKSHRSELRTPSPPPTWPSKVSQFNIQIATEQRPHNEQSIAMELD